MARRAAFTLVELLLVLIIIGLVAGTAVPSLVESMRAFRMNNSVSTFDHLNRYARAMAVLKQVRTELYVDLENNELRLTIEEANAPEGDAEALFASSGLVGTEEPEWVDEEEEELNPAERRRVTSGADRKVRALGRDVVVEDFEVPEDRIDGTAGFSIMYYPSGLCDGATIVLADTRRPDDRLARTLRIDPITGDFSVEFDE